MGIPSAASITLPALGVLGVGKVFERGCSKGNTTWSRGLEAPSGSAMHMAQQRDADLTLLRTRQ